MALWTFALPPWSEFIWDVAERTLKYFDHSTGGYTGGYAFSDANDPPLPRYFPVPCGTGHIILEPATACLSFVSAQYYYNGLPLGSVPHFPHSEVEIQERMGCA